MASRVRIALVGACLAGAALLIWWGARSRPSEAAVVAEASESATAERHDAESSLQRPDGAREPGRSERAPEVSAGCRIVGSLVGCAHEWGSGRARLTGAGGEVYRAPISRTGLFAFSGLARGAWTLEFEEVTGHRRAPLRIALNGDLEGLEVELEPYLALDVEFLDGEGKPIRSTRLPCRKTALRSVLLAVVEAVSGAPDGSRSCTEASARIGGVATALGRFETSTGRLEVTAHLPVRITAYAGRTSLATQLLEAPADRVVFRIDDTVLSSACGGLRGIVVDAVTGRGLHERSAVGRIDTPDAEYYLLQRTAEDGSFLIDGLPAGPCNVLFELDDHERIVRDVVVPRGAVLDMGIVALGPGTALTGTVTDPAGRPVVASDLRVVVVPRERAGAPDVAVPKVVFWPESGGWAAGEIPCGDVLVGVADSHWAMSPIHVAAQGEIVRGVDLVVREGVPVTIERPDAIAAGGSVRVWSGLEPAGVPLPVGSRSHELLALLPGCYRVEWSWKGERRSADFEVASAPVTLRLGHRLEFAESGG